MNSDPPDEYRGPEFGDSLSRSNRIDELCDSFVRGWLAEESPRIKEALAAATDIDRTSLLRELLPVELEVRRTNGESPSPPEYESRFPDEAIRPHVVEQLQGGPYWT